MRVFKLKKYITIRSAIAITEINTGKKEQMSIIQHWSKCIRRSHKMQYAVDIFHLIHSIILILKNDHNILNKSCNGIIIVNSVIFSALKTDFYGNIKSTFTLHILVKCYWKYIKTFIFFNRS